MLDKLGNVFGNMYSVDYTLIRHNVYILKCRRLHVVPLHIAIRIGDQIKPREHKSLWPNSGFSSMCTFTLCLRPRSSAKTFFQVVVPTFGIVQYMNLYSSFTMMYPKFSRLTRGSFSYEFVWQYCSMIFLLDACLLIASITNRCLFNFILGSILI